MLVEALHIGNMGFYEVVESFHKVSLGDSTPCHCKKFRLESVGLGGGVTVMNLVAVHLKELDRGGIWVLN